MPGAGAGAGVGIHIQRSWISSTQKQVGIESRTGSLPLKGESFPHNSHYFLSISFTENSYGHSDHLWPRFQEKF